MEKAVDAGGQDRGRSGDLDSVWNWEEMCCPHQTLCSLLPGQELLLMSTVSAH